MADPGDIWFRSLSNVGNSLADAMNEYHKRHEAYDQADQIATKLSQVGMTPDGNIVLAGPTTGSKGKSNVTPLLSPDAVDIFRAKTASEREKATGALNALSRVGIDMMKQSAIAGIRQRIGEQGMSGQLRQAQITASKSRAKLTDVQTMKALGMLPEQPKAPTGGQIIAEQRAQRKSLLDQQKTVANILINQKASGQNITDPQILLDDKNIDFGQKDSFGRFYSKPVTDPNASLARIQGGKDDGSDLLIPIKQFQRLRSKAEEWHSLGQKANELQTNHGLFNQAWSGITPQQQQVATQKLMSNPTPEMKGFFDKKFGPGAADTILSAGSASAPSATPAPSDSEPDASGDTDTIDEEDNAGADQFP